MMEYSADDPVALEVSRRGSARRCTPMSIRWRGSRSSSWLEPTARRSISSWPGGIRHAGWTDAGIA